MKVIEIPFCFYPDPVGGTEIYVEALSLGLQGQGVEVVVAAPTESSPKGVYFHRGLPVRRFPARKRIDNLRELYGVGDGVVAEGFGRILDEESPDLVHLHALTRASSLRLVREVRKRGIPVLFTYHTPTASCQRGTLMRWGSEVCQGVLDVGLCTRCTLHGLGVPRGVADLIGCAPVSVGHWLGVAGLSGGVWTALRMRELVYASHEAFHALMAEIDHVIAVCEWVRDLLVLNGIPPAKITLSRQGLPQVGNSELSLRGQNRADNSKHPNSPLRIAFLGRLDVTKGLDVLIQALKMAPDLAVTLDIYGVVAEGANGTAYFQRLQSLAAEDPRIGFRAPLPSGEVVECLRGYDLLAVPSQGLETGPLVILEAFAAGVPVLGTRLGGIAELVEHEVNGLLVETSSPEGWLLELQGICRDRGVLERLRAGISYPRTMAMVAEEMKNLYQQLTHTE